MTAEKPVGDGYKWVALSNTTLGVLIVTINMSILLIALPDIFKGIDISPLAPGNISYLLWLIMGYLVVTAVLVVSFGRVGDMYGRTRMYNLGFAVFTVFSILLAVTWMHGDAGALWLISMRVLQGIGGALLLANSTAILTDAFPTHQRGLALGINSVAAIAGSFIGLIIGGVLAPVNWHLVFVVSVPIGVFGTIWAYLKLREAGERHVARIDWWGNVTFAVGLIAVLMGITYGIQPYGGHVMGWTSPMVLTLIIGGVVVLAVFAVIETRVPEPMFHLSLFRIRAFTAGNVASLLAALGRGGLQFILIIWLQGIWLPQHGYDYESTPLWAGIYMVPLTIGFLVAGPLSGILSDRYGARTFATVGMVVAAASFLALKFLPVDFAYAGFAVILAVNGLAMGLFSSPNRAAIMNSVPPDQRGAAAGMTSTFQNSATVLSIGIFFSMLILGLSSTLPASLYNGLTQHGVPGDVATGIAGLPPVSTLFAALLGYNPIQTLLGPQVLAQIGPDQAAYLTGRSFFPQLISGPFADGLTFALVFAAVCCLVAAFGSLLRGGKYAHEDSVVATTAAEPAQPAQPAQQPAERPAATGTVLGHVLAPDGAGLHAVVTLVGHDGQEAARAVTGDDGAFHLGPPRSGDYVLVATPRDGAATAFSPRADRVSVNGGPAAMDLVLRPRVPLRGV
ncbi:MFS transporter [Actinomycetospora sp. NBRC 106375]|uniref:MFS transporter n=1 Tax=Actinomycetospora sp. NBRC 106375 TaxID=3032207 RepID=UPI0024A3A166|nr:MFS transporter [Actinomycetospora sp. NBRC 106375]GLZ43938.1 MFS transporter [Actinomycetospora sp. NBRC 106375]